jgi:hypothetical protein
MSRISAIFLLLVFCKISTGQTDSTFKSLLNDSIINKIYSYLPKGWIVTEGKNQLIFQYPDSVISLEGSRFDTTYLKEIKAERIERIKTFGKKGLSRIVLNYETKWSYTKLLTTKNTNSTYSQKLKKLPEKYGITALYNKELSTKQNPLYIGVTDNEKNAVKKYENERKEILAKITTMPNYNTEKYTFFLVSYEGCNDDSHFVIPEEASLQMYKILSLFFEYAGQ